MRALSVGLLMLGLFGCKGGSKAPPTRPATPASKAASAAPASAAPSAVAAPAKASASPDWAAIQAADDGCADCHPDEAEAWAGSPMGRSFRPVEAGTHPPFKTPASLRHPVTGLTYRQAAGRFSEVAGEQTFRKPAALVVGSGSHASSYLWAAVDRVFELPLTWYTERKAWDLSPGYERGAHPGSFRAVTSGCVACHADPVAPKPGTKSFFQTLPHRGMGCARCHGDGRAHAKARLAGGDAPITSPKGLSTERANDMCGLCHFPGAARILRAGRGVQDYLPGQPLSDVAAVFVREVPPDGFGSTSHNYRLGMSACAKKTPGGLKCVTCHDPHPTQAAGDRAAACRGCHGPKGDAAQHACAGPGGQDCVRCHMDAGQAQNVPHVSATDHFIRTRPETKPPKNNASPLLWVADPQPHPRDPDHQILLGRAYVEAWRADQQPADAERAEQWLSKGLAALPGRVDGWIELAALRRLKGDRAGMKAAAERAYALAPSDRRVAVITGAARLASDAPKAALEALDQAAALGDDAEVQVLRARALRTVGRGAEAAAAVKAATALQPTSAEAWLGRGLLAAGSGDFDTAAEALQRAVAWQPGDLRAWMNLGQVQGRRGEWAASLAAWGAARERAGQDQQAAHLADLGALEAFVALERFADARPLGMALLQVGRPLPGLPRLMAQVHLAAGEQDLARQAIEAATRFEPQDARTWLARSKVLAALGDREGAAGAAAQAETLMKR